MTTDDGVDLYYRSVGDGPATVVVPVAVWLSPHFDPIAGEGYSVVYYDPRGRGRSGVGDLAAVSLERATRDLELLRSNLHLDRMALVGWSGYGLEVAAYALAHPERVSRLVQLNPVPPRQEPFMTSRIEGIRGRIDPAEEERYRRMKAGGADPSALCRQYNLATAPAFFAHPEAAAATIERVCANRNEWPDEQARFFDAFMPSIAELDLRPRLAELTMPRLVIYGDRDLIPLDGVREWLDGGGPARLLVVKGADHGSFLDAPEVVVAAIRKFLAGSWPDGAA